MVAALPFTAIQNSLHTCATVKQSCSSLDLDSCLPFRVYTFQLISLTVWYSAGSNLSAPSTYSSNRLKWLCAVLVKYSSVLHYAKGIKYSAIKLFPTKPHCTFFQNQNQTKLQQLQNHYATI